MQNINSIPISQAIYLISLTGKEAAETPLLLATIKTLTWQFKNFQDNSFSSHPIEMFNFLKKTVFLGEHKFAITSLAKRARGNSSQMAGRPLIIKKEINLARKEILLFPKVHIN